mmetsp:Transcript_5948/g.13752  ORF Transcript_5948/g.13752 Transcript_5948/m.13752 type:complete len:268 (+) Transcript_5948:785-1588(+)
MLLVVLPELVQKVERNHPDRAHDEQGSDGGEGEVRERWHRGYRDDHDDDGVHELCDPVCCPIQLVHARSHENSRGWKTSKRAANKLSHGQCSQLLRLVEVAELIVISSDVRDLGADESLEDRNEADRPARRDEADEVLQNGRQDRDLRERDDVVGQLSKLSLEHREVPPAPLLRCKPQEDRRQRDDNHPRDLGAYLRQGVQRDHLREEDYHRPPLGPVEVCDRLPKTVHKLLVLLQPCQTQRVIDLLQADHQRDSHCEPFEHALGHE